MDFETLRDKLENLTEEDIVFKGRKCEPSMRSILSYNYNLIKSILGMPFEFLDTERDYSTYYWYFSLGDKIYRYDGYYDSWAGTEWNGALQEVRRVTKKIKVWEIVNE